MPKEDFRWNHIQLHFLSTFQSTFQSTENVTGAFQFVCSFKMVFWCTRQFLGIPEHFTPGFSDRLIVFGRFEQNGFDAKDVGQ